MAPALDALSVASLIAAWAKPQQFDLVLAGVMSEDLQRCQVGPMLAQLLNLPCATTVVKIDFSKNRKKIVCERELEAGARERVELPLPALLTIQSGINIPRYASLSNVLRVKKIEIPVMLASELGKSQRCEKIEKAFLQEQSAVCEFLKGDPSQVADDLIDRIRSRLHIL
jgi:electron transfer flavoprotein beta subunit